MSKAKPADLATEDDEGLMSAMDDDSSWNRATAKGMAKLPVPDEAAGLLVHTDSWVIDNLAAIKVPVLQIVGERDEMFLRSTNYMATKLGGPTTTLVIPGAGHHVHRSAADATNQAIDTFLAALPTSGE